MADAKLSAVDSFPAGAQTPVIEWEGGMRATRMLVCVISSCAVLTMAGCAVTPPPAKAVATTSSSPVNKGTNPPLTTDPFADPASDAVIVYDAQLVSMPLPEPPPTTAIAETAARAAAAPNGPTIGPDARPTATSATLRMVATDTSALTPSHPAWIVIWTHTPPMAGRAVGDHWSGRPECVTVIVVDATSGTTHGATQFCRTLKN